jgi:hypothetical protein
VLFDVAMAFTSMKKLLIVIAITASILPTTMADESKINDKLMAAARHALSSTMDKKALDTMILGGLWNTNKTALVASHHKSGGSVVYIFIRQASGDFLPVDVSRVEEGNFGRLGFRRTHYHRFETVPTEWSKRDDSKLQVWIRTRAWKNGQRFTVAEPVLVASDGTIFWR